MQISKSHRYVSASGPLNPQAALAVAENEGWRIPPVVAPVAGTRPGARIAKARVRSMRARDSGYVDHG
jgi:hypothetical protein